MATPQDNGDSFATQPLQAVELERGERLLYRLTEFGRILWESGIDVGPRKLLDLAETLGYIDITNQEDFYQTLKCSLMARHEQEMLFNQLYNYYWYTRDSKNKAGNDPGTAKRDDRQIRLPPSERKRLAEHLNATSEQRRELRPEMRESERPRRAEELSEAEDQDPGDPQGTAYSAIEMLRRKDFESFTWEEVQEAKKLMAEMRWHLGQR
ncbi:MAG: hypothetical protein M3Z08_11830, partial [Chloroflexota bacterium]|nr:hypothetical protein [Chloroflexota bacterium]